MWINTQHGGIMSKFTALNKNVVVRRRVKETKSESGLFLLNGSVPVSDEAEVISAAAGSELLPGDRVLLSRSPKHTFQIDGEDCLLVREEELLGYWRQTP
jgi:co-chaperonin GroES (HSP10)